MLAISNRCEVILYYCLDLHFPDNLLLMLSILSCACWPHLLWNTCIQAPVHFKIRFLKTIELYEFLKYILDINPLSGIWFADTFLSVLWLPFILLMVSIAM